MQDRHKQYQETLKAQRKRITTIIRRHKRGESMGRIADDLGISRQRVGQIIAAAKEKKDEAR